MYLPQAVSLPPLPGIEWDLFRHIHIVHDVELEPTVVSSSFSELLFPAISVHSRKVRKDKTGPFLSRIAPNLLLQVIGVGPWK